VKNLKAPGNINFLKISVRIFTCFAISLKFLTSRSLNTDLPHLFENAQEAFLSTSKDVGRSLQKLYLTDLATSARI